MRLLIINADDYGMCEGVSRGILRAAQACVTSTTVMGNLVTQAQIDALLENGIRAGAHLNLSYGPPVSTDYPRELLLPDGRMNKALALDPLTWSDTRFAMAAHAEYRSQLERLESMGLWPSHLDSHHHTHMFSDLYPAALEEARRRGMAIRCRANGQDAARSMGLNCPDLFIEDFFGVNNIGWESLARLLDRAQAETPDGAVVELMCHPGLVDDVLRRDSSYVDERETELELLGDPAVAGRLRELGWRLTDYTLG